MTAAEAYFYADDVLSIGILSAIEQVGLNIPEDIGLIGLNDMEITAWQNINLTTIQQPFSRMINYSVTLIEAMLDDPELVPQARIFPTGFFERGTLRPLK